MLDKEKIYVRKVETWTVSASSEPIEVNVEALRKCKPPYEGDSEEELIDYLQEEVWNESDFYEDEHNKEVYGEDELYDLGMEECYVENEIYNSRNNETNEMIQIGEPNDELTKDGGFKVKANSN
jgi:hypothetical protein